MTEIAAAAGISAGTARSYSALWNLFTDWCAAADRMPLPADPDTVLQFMAECPAAPATHRRRVIAIDHHHTATGLPSPVDDDRVRAAVGRPPRDQVFVPRNADAVHATLRLLPSSGWTAGVFGRRDRCLLVLAELGGVPYRHIAATAAGDVAFENGTVVITANGATYRLTSAEDPVLCPACAVARWLEVLNVAVRHLATVAIAQHLREADRVVPSSPHRCRLPVNLDPQTWAQPLLAPIDQWGSFPFPLRRLSPHAVSRHTRDLVAGELAAHRDRPVPGVHDTAERRPAPAPATPPYKPEDWAAAVQRRRRDLTRLSRVADDLADVERRAADLNDRVVQLLDRASASPDGR